jgi:leucyl-tRNA synthetase/very-short-patch-repair endonuclease
MEYNFRKIEKEWQQKWIAGNAYKVSNESTRPKFYVLDMFPYPSGAGLHVGHPLGYIASDIYARYKRLKGYNVLHPMGYDSFGLPAEQYALETGQHPAVTTEKNIATFRSQLDKIGFSFDWSREVKTSDPGYYKWTQWIFLQIFDSWYNHSTNKAERIATLINIFEKEGSKSKVKNQKSKLFSAEEWKNFDEKKRQEILMDYRLAYSAYGEVNWCEALGTVLANDEVVNGVSERGGHPVVKKKMRQWYMRITEYADRLLDGLEKVDFSESLKEQQRNWIGKSYGAEMNFDLTPDPSPKEGAAVSDDSLLTTHDSPLTVYTTRPDTIFGVDFMVIAPEHGLVAQITTAAQKEAIDNYLSYVKSRSDRERMSEVKQITGCFTGAYAINPFDGRAIPIWIAEYVLAGYGTGAIMAVPCGDERDYNFAKHFDIPITNIIGERFNGEEANPTKDAILTNSGFLNGMVMRDAMEVVITKLEQMGIGKRKINYKMRDAGFSRQRYWGEPFPIVWKDGVAIPLDEKELPLELPHVDKYGPGPEGEGPLANLNDWVIVPSPPAPLHGVERGASAQESLQNETGGAKERDITEAIANVEKKAAALVPKYNVRTPVQYELAKEMRKGHTEAEEILWQQLRNDQLGEKFSRQYRIDAYIVDFTCLQKALIVEVDGDYHENAEQQLYDAERTKTLTEIGFQVIRFTNEEVIKNTKGVIKQIKLTINQHQTAISKETYGGAPLATAGGEGPGVRETSTMPGYAGSSWYFLRYMDPHNNHAFCERKVSDYWGQVDLYIGGTEHAVGHLLYSRMWTKVLFDLGYIGHDEPYKKLVNQGMIQGVSAYAALIGLTFFQVVSSHNQSIMPLTSEDIVNIDNLKEKYRIIKNKYISNDLVKYFGEWQISESEEIEILQNVVLNDTINRFKDPLMNLVDNEISSLGLSRDKVGYSFRQYYITIPIEYVNLKNELDFERLKTTDRRFNDAEFITLEGKFLCSREVEKMSKSKFNVVNPDDIIQHYGADTFRMYEMFLGPVEASKPWDTKGIEGVHRFLKKLWRLFYAELKGKVWNNDKAVADELKILHRTIKKIEDDTERFSFNTAVSSFMICVNELADIKCHKKEMLEPVLVLLTPYAPHIAEELWHLIGNSGSILDASYPAFDPKYVTESSKEYPISINGKVRTNINIALDAAQPEVEQIVLGNETVQKWLEGKAPKKIIYVKNKMVNVVV